DHGQRRQQRLDEPGLGAEPAAAELHAAAVVYAATGVRPARPDSSRERVIRNGGDPSGPSRRRREATRPRVDGRPWGGGRRVLLAEPPDLPLADDRAAARPPAALHLLARRDGGQRDPDRPVLRDAAHAA